MNESNKTVNELVKIGNVTTVGKRWKQEKSNNRYNASMKLLEDIRKEETAKGSFGQTVDEIVAKSNDSIYEQEVSRWVGISIQ
jgi:hypothetical protein